MKNFFRISDPGGKKKSRSRSFKILFYAFPHADLKKIANNKFLSDNIIQKFHSQKWDFTRPPYSAQKFRWSRRETPIYSVQVPNIQYRYMIVKDISLYIR
jgi:hypothetical protein